MLGSATLRHRLGAAFVVVDLVTVVPAAHAEETEPSIRVAWFGPAECPSPSWVSRRTEEFLGRAIAEAATERVSAHFVAARSPLGFSAHAEIAIGADHLERDLSDPDCLVVADAAAFVLASAIDPGVKYGDAPPLDVRGSGSSAPELDVAPKRVTANGEPRPSQHTRPGRTTLSGARKKVGTRQERPVTRRSPLAKSVELDGAIFAALGLHGGVLPEVAPEVRIGGMFHADWFQTMLTAGWAPPQDRFDGASPGGRFQLLASTLDACALAVEKPLRIPLCVRLEAGAVLGDGQGLSRPAQSVLPWVGLGGSVAGWFALGHSLSLGADVAVTGGLVRPRFSVNDGSGNGGGVIHVATPVSAAGSLLLAWSFL